VEEFGFVVCDADDEMKRMFLPRCDIRRLDDMSCGVKTGDIVLGKRERDI